VLLMPLLVLVLRISPLLAVGTALTFMAITKSLAVALHWKQRTVDLTLAGYLALGSIPGALAGSAGLAFLHSRLGSRVDNPLRITIATCLILISVLSIIVESHKTESLNFSNSSRGRTNAEPITAACIGLVGGFLVSATSIGSGSLIILLLIMFCPRHPATLVGTDIFHGMVLSIFAACLHRRLNFVDWHILRSLLLGSFVGVTIGARLSILASTIWLRRCLFVLAMLGGLAMLWPN
jgi:uncharacterized protein